MQRTILPHSMHFAYVERSHQIDFTHDYEWMQKIGFIAVKHRSNTLKHPYDAAFILL